MRRVLIGLLVLAALGGGGWYVWLRPATVGAGDPVLYGNVDIRQVELGFRLAGRIEAMRFEEGDPVTAGTLLATLDRQPFRDELALWQAEVAREMANLERLETGTRPAEIEQARATVAEREAALRNAERTLVRRRMLFERGAGSEQTYDDALAERDEAQARLQSAQEALDLALEGFRQEDIAAGRAALAAARARLQAAQTALADTALTTPAGGVILSRVREPGAIVAAGNTVYTVSLTRPVWVRAYVPEPSLGLIHPGMQVEVITDTAPDRPYAGQIGFVSPVAEFTPRTVETPELRSDLVFRFRVIIDDPDEGLRQGMPVTVRLAATETSGG